MGFLSSISASSLLVLVALTSALSIPDLAELSVNGVLELPFKRVTAAPGSKGNLTTRGDDFQYPLTNWDLIGYFADVKVGTPPQTVLALIDTGSADLVIDQSKFTPSKSSTLQSEGTVTTPWKVGTVFLLYKDTISLEQFTLKDYQLATWDNNLSLLGLGPKGQEVASTSSPGKEFWDPPQVKTYNNVPWALAAAGLINKPAFSIYLQEEPYDDDSYSHSYTNGVVLFGGIDHAKYVGDLATYPIISEKSNDVNLDWIVFADGSTYQSASATIDTGTTTSTFPDGLVDRIKALFGPYDSDHNIISYNESWATTYLEFKFPSSTVKVPYADFVQSNGKGGYKWNNLGTNGDSIILGDIFLRNAYTVFDYEANTILIAQAAKDAYNTSNISVIS